MMIYILPSETQLSRKTKAYAASSTKDRLTQAELKLSDVAIKTNYVSATFQQFHGGRMNAVFNFISRE